MDGKEKEGSEGRKKYSDIDAVGRNANTAEEAEGGAVGVVKGEDVIEVGNLDVVVIEEDTIFISSSFVLLRHGLRKGLMLNRFLVGAVQGNPPRCFHLVPELGRKFNLHGLGLVFQRANGIGHVTPSLLCLLTCSILRNHI